MSAEPAALLEAAKASDPGKDRDVHMLLDQQEYAVAADGSSDRRYRFVYVVRTKEGAESWGILSDSWSPWREDHPVLAARVITPDGVVHELDPKQIVESTDPSSDPLVMSDVHELRGPLPALVPGAVVEETIVEHARAPLVAEGDIASFLLARSGTVERTRLHVAVADPQPFAWKIESSDVKPVEAHRKGVHSLDIDLPARSFSVFSEPGVPADVRPPALYVSTASSWSALAASYARLVDAELSGDDLSARAKAAKGTATERRAVIAALLADVRSLRYTGVEFGRQAIVPGRPDEVIARGYGDCKDKATLLVGLLRAVGIPAEVALLDADLGPDIGPLPGLDDFNHAIVHVDGPDELWIDPTSDWTPVGQLPFEDQGRKALIASPTTKAPALTPLAASSDNAVHVVREVTLADSGPASVVETMTRTGWIAAVARPDYDGATADDLRSYFAGRAKDIYIADAIDTPKVSAPGDLATPFATSFAMASAGYGQTGPDEASARLARRQVFDFLPDWLLSAPAADEDPRRQDLIVPPHQVDIEEHVRAPVPYVLATLPDAVSDGVGPMTWAVTYAAAPDGSVVAHVRFDTGNGRLTPEQVGQLRAKLSTLLAGDMPMIRYDHAGARALADGHTGDALAVYRKQVAAKPGDAHTLDEWASVLLKVGFGDEARKQSAAALALAPDDATIAANAAYALLHDPGGAYLADGWDPTGAKAITDRALAVHPDDARLYAIRAVIAATSADGRSFGPGTDLAATIQALYDRRKLAHDTGLDGDLAADLVRASRWTDLAALVPELPQGEVRNGYTVLLATIQGGGPAGLAASAKLAGSAEDRRAALTAAGSELINLRRYADAAALIEAGAVGSANPAAERERAHRFATLRPYEQIAIDNDDPSRLPLRLYIAAAAGTREDVVALLSKELAGLPAENGQDIASAFIEGVRSAKLPAGVTSAVLIDSISTLAVTTDGSASTGWRLQVKTPDGSSAGTFYAIKERGQVRLRSTGTPGEVGVEALKLASHDELLGARRWLEWEHDEVPGAVASGPFDGTPFDRFWRDPTDKTSLRVAAALLMSREKERVDEAIEVLLAELGPVTDANERTQIERALFDAYVTKEKWGDAVLVADRLRKDNPDSTRAIGSWAYATFALGHSEDALKALQDALSQKPDDIDLLRADVALKDLGTDADARFAATERLLASPKANASDYNTAAWENRDHPTEALAWATKATTLTAYKDQASLHTLATVFVDAGRTDEAHEVLVQAEADPKAKDHADDWEYLRGRLAEAWGLFDTAIALYDKVPPATASMRENDLHREAKRRRDALAARAR